jgi:hypothetical protein
MLKMKSIVSVEVNGKDYEFYCSPDSPLPDALEANNQINAFLLGKVEQAKQAQAAPAVEEQQKSE